MNTELFSYFEALAQERNVTRTASKLGLTQQALSAQMSRLEKHYNVKLFDRENHFALTYAGERLLEYCRRLDVWSAQVNSEMKDIAQGDRGIITIGATSKRSYDILPAVFKVFHKEWPHVQVDVREGRKEELLQDILAQKMDFCFLVSNTDNPRIVSIPVFEESIQLFVSDNILREYCGEHYEEITRNRRNEFPIQYFAKCPFIFQGSKNRVRDNCSQLFEKNDIIPNIIFSSTNAMNLLELTRQGLGAAFLNASTRVEMGDGFYRLKIQDLSRPEHLKILYLKDHYLSKSASRFIELSQEILPKM